MKISRHISFFLFGLFMAQSFCGLGQLNKEEVMRRIQSLQVVEDSFYDPGLFPCQRSWSFSREWVEDNTIFFTASIAATLRQLPISGEHRAVADQIIAQAMPVYAKYGSRNGEPTYNFWQTVEPDLPFPNGGRLISNSKMRLPDDYDTSCLIAQAMDNDSLDALVRNKMVDYAVREDRRENQPTTLKNYKESRAYEVWFAKKMPQTFDICVMSNLMYFIFDRQFELNEPDSATIRLIKEMIANDDHINETKYISHHASSPALILYHVSRMMSKDPEGFFVEIEEKVKADLRQALTDSESEMEKVLILTSMIRLGIDPGITPDFERLAEDVNDFVFFSVKPFGSGFSSLKMDGISPSIDWYSEAYNWTLVYEYLVLSDAD